MVSPLVFPHRNLKNTSQLLPITMSPCPPEWAKWLQTIITCTHAHTPSIWWDSWGFKTEILSNPMESYGFHEILQFKSYQISSYPKCYGSMVQKVLIIKGENRKDLARSTLTYRGGYQSGVGIILNYTLWIYIYMVIWYDYIYTITHIIIYIYYIILVYNITII